MVDGRVRALLGARGVRTFAATPPSFETFGEGGLDLLLQAASGGHVGSGRAAQDTEGRSTETIEVLGLAASHWPQRLAKLVVADAHLRRHSRFPPSGPTATCLHSCSSMPPERRSTCDQYTRWCA